METWKPVVSHGGVFAHLYEVSDAGRIRSLNRIVRGKGGILREHRGRILKGGIDSDGYILHVLVGEGMRWVCKAHRIVLEAFVPPNATQTHVNHKNFIKIDNRVENLEWVTHTQNMQHSSVSGKLAATYNPRKAKKLTATQASAIRTALARGERQIAIARRFGVCDATISSIRHGETWKEAGGVEVSRERLSNGTKLTMEKARAIRAAHAAGAGPTSLAAAYGISPSMVTLIVSGRSWREA